ncbi:MAG: aspartate carbamoyltransferase regulatory subunit [Bacteroidales bacterium]|nr:aspartate carbamoyltransferase regulatory subunit [Bacteroidales bacterium]MCR5037487.1 aspartate carbamoyltransferase regulatory subunit [Bacteroidales bacterium]
MEKRKELIVSAIENGTVIDHIPADKVFQVVKILGLDNVSSPVYFGINVESKKYGKKGFIKVSDKYFEPEDYNKIGLVAPTASIIEIKDFEVIKKQTVTLPESIEHIVKCFNPNCVTNKEHDVPTKFTVIKDAEGNIKLHCHYCEKNTTQDKLEFI